MYKKKITFDQKQTQWLGMWYHPENHCYTSESISLSALREFKGTVRLIMRKNKFYEKGSNKPDYVFKIVDANAEAIGSEIELAIEDYDYGYLDDLIRQIPSDSTGKREWYSRDEVYEVMHGTCESTVYGCTDPYDHMISDFIDDRLGRGGE